MFYKAEPAGGDGPETRLRSPATYSKLEAKRYLYERARLPLEKFSPENIERRFRNKFPERYAQAGLDALVPWHSARKNHDCRDRRGGQGTRRVSRPSARRARHSRAQLRDGPARRNRCKSFGAAEDGRRLFPIICVFAPGSPA